jgi:DNA mismatch repair protein MutS2
MNKKAMELLEYDKIKETLKSYAVSDLGREAVEQLEPSVDIHGIEKNMKETDEARAIINISSSIPIHSLTGIGNVRQKQKKGMVLSSEDLELVAGLLRDTRKLKAFMKGKESIAPIISRYALSIYDLDELRQEIERCIAYGRVDDKASPQLGRLRKKIAILEERVKSKLDSVLKSDRFKGYIQDAVVSQRNGRYVIPVKSEYKKNLEGEIHDRSGSGSTVFVEPAEVKKAQDELNMYRIEEEKEVYIILSTLTNLVEGYSRELSINIETMAHYDFVFAKGKYSRTIDGRSAPFNTRNYIRIRRGRHPLLGSHAVPLDFEMGDSYKAVVITGPNTGGKTVALKTVGLLTMMAQSGLHVPVGEGSELAVFADVLADIGDGQSIQQNLSTFSAHIKNIIDILNCADPHTLVIMDEIGSGTDPGEGMGLAVAILKEIYGKGSSILATTHYSEIKDFAKNQPGFINGSMSFDIQTLKPLYELSIGKAGESNAFLIALRLGMNKQLIETAHEITYKEKKNYSSYHWGAAALPGQPDGAEASHKLQLEKMKKAEQQNALGEKQKQKPQFNIGDCVKVSSMGRTGIVCETENAKGEYAVMVMKKKLKINKTRLSLYIAKDQLYPEDYDFDIVFETKQNRRNKRILDKEHQEGVEVIIKKE